MLKCKLCNFETDSQLKFSKHTSFHHKLKFADYLIQTKYNGIQPLCKCGCNKPTKYEAGRADFPDYLRGHAVRIKGWGNLNSEKRVNAIKATRKAKFASGEYDHIKKAIKKARKDPNLGKKISEGSKGIPKPKPDGFGIGRIQSKKTRQKMSISHTENWENGKMGDRKHYTSKLEKTFENILILMNIKYIKHHFAKSIKAFYDFYLPDYNILIEVDGDFWHCNPNTKHKEAKYKTQQDNLIRDQQKNEWASQNGYKLLRFWENDINNNISHIKQILTENIS